MGLVLPGEPIAVEEEAMPITGVYAGGDGYLRSMVVGLVTLDKYRKTVQVKPIGRRELVIKQGSLVEGVVVSVSEDLAVIRIYSVDNYRTSAIGLLHISQISSEYVADIYEYVKPSDIIRARVLTSIPPYLLSTREPATGVILAYCSHCGNYLYMQASGSLKCKGCGGQEKRKTAVGYLYTLR